MKHPLWHAGFRPMFLLAFISGAVLPLAWGLIFSGRMGLPNPQITALQWHAHEMLFGFGWAVLGGFLLTASKNWVKIRGIHGAPLAVLTLLWIIERFALLYSGSLPWIFRIILVNAFLLGCAGYVFYSLVRYRHQDTFKDNYFFLIGLPLFLIAKNLLLNLLNGETYAIGVAMSIGLFRLAFAVMLERTTPQFMKNAMQIELPRYRILDLAIKFLVLIAVFSPLLPDPYAWVLYAATASLMTVRFATWMPHKGLRQFGIALMYLGHFALIVHFFLESLRSYGIALGIGTISTHVFTFLVMGIIIPGMLIRICQGHTGRKLVFTVSDRLALASMCAGAVARLVLTQLWPAHYTEWIIVAALGWSLCFVIIGIRLAPFLWQARVDGKVH